MFRCVAATCMDAQTLKTIHTFNIYTWRTDAHPPTHPPTHPHTHTHIPAHAAQVLRFVSFTKLGAAKWLVAKTGYSTSTIPVLGNAPEFVMMTVLALAAGFLVYPTPVFGAFQLLRVK